MINMWVGDEYGCQICSPNRRNQGLVIDISIQRKAQVKRYAHARVRIFDTGTANLCRTSVNTYLHMFLATFDSELLWRPLKTNRRVDSNGSVDQ